MEFEAVRVEPFRAVADTESVDHHLINFHKKVLRFYLYKNDFVRDLMENKAHRDHFFGEISSYLLFSAKKSSRPLKQMVTAVMIIS
ncbi:hypothetical protein ABK905_14515 [Acerihabitans sp. KWT182]|uniref:Uncharacterized protein n=1 Tax=Acerihabitans sp. KWT182 TaxID=3157919 RepID=A0AAU7Q4K5_9GAMM